jgi:hypothetical protein
MMNYSTSVLEDDFRPELPVEQVVHHLTLPFHKRPEGWWNWPNVQQAQRLLADAFLANLPPYPACYSGRGIVIAGGGKYLPAAYVTVRVLRHVGCLLPVQLWHLAGEMDDTARSLFGVLGVTCVDADEVSWRHPFRFLDGHWWKGWQLKVYALLHAPFRELLLLDADCYPTVNPEFLFDSPHYRDLGALFWPSCTVPGPGLSPAAWAAFGMEPHDDLPAESGQLLVDKERCWRELNLAAHYNSQADYTYRHILGDKDTFPIAWRRLGREYGCLWPRAGLDGPAVLQYDDQGRVLFLHRALEKFTLGPTCFSSSVQHGGKGYYPHLAHEDFCHQVLEELRGHWVTWWNRLERLWHTDDPERPSPELRRHYQIKYDLAARLRPARIAELHMHTGYSAFALLSAVPHASYLASPGSGGSQRWRARLEEIRLLLRGFNACVLPQITWSLPSDGSCFDLLLLDATQMALACPSSIVFAARSARHLLIDQVSFSLETSHACQSFLAAHTDMRIEAIDDGARGMLLLIRRER